MSLKDSLVISTLIGCGSAIVLLPASVLAGIILISNEAAIPEIVAGIGIPLAAAGGMATIAGCLFWRTVEEIRKIPGNENKTVRQLWRDETEEQQAINAEYYENETERYCF